MLITMRRALVVLPALLLVACSSDAASCNTGVSFYVADIAGTLGAGASVPVTVCFDGDCKDITVSHDDDVSPVFVKFGGIADDGDHSLKVTVDGGTTQTYDGPVQGFGVDGGCTVGAVKLGADGTITPGSAAPTTTVAATSTTAG